MVWPNHLEFFQPNIRYCVDEYLFIPYIFSQKKYNETKSKTFTIISLIVFELCTNKDRKRRRKFFDD